MNKATAVREASSRDPDLRWRDKVCVVCKGTAETWASHVFVGGGPFINTRKFMF